MRAMTLRGSSLAIALLVCACTSTPPAATLRVQPDPAGAGAPVGTTGKTGSTPAPAASAPASTAPSAPVADSPTPTDSPSQTTSASPSASPSSGTSTGGDTTSSSPQPSPTASHADAGGGTGLPVVTPAPATTPAPTVAPVPTVGTFAGRASQGWVDTDAIDALFTTPYALGVAGTTALFVGDQGDHRIRRIDLVGAAHNVSTVAGSGSAGYRDAIGTSASFNNIRAIAVDASGNLYVADGGNTCIRKVDMTDPSNPNVSTFAGVHGVTGHIDDLASRATFNGIWGLVIVGTTLYEADAGNHCIRAIDLVGAGNPVTTYAGSGASGTADGSAASAQFKAPQGLAADSAGNLYVSDAGAHNIRMISATDPSHAVTTIAGSGSAGFANGSGTAATFNTPRMLTLGPDGNLYVADTSNHAIRRVLLSDVSHPVTTYAGTGVAGFQDASAPSAQFNTPVGLLWTGGTLYVADSANFRVRSIR